jgi:hypothetical protein
MAKNVLEKELHYSLKQMRLQNLVLAGQCLADGDEAMALSFLETFKDSIPPEHTARRLLQDEYDALAKDEDALSQKIKEMSERLGYLERQDLSKGMPEELQKKSVRKYMSLCQGAALSYELIPKE